MYLTNEDRIRLGVQAYGSDVPDDVVAAAEAALAGACCFASEKSSAKKQARKKNGEFRPDDPATPEVNEAFELDS